MARIKICDALMGSGKTEGAIRYMNEHPDQKFLYLTQYLPEAKRIKDSCPDLDFMEPSDQIPAFHFAKTEHCAWLLEQGRNIASTHQLFKLYTDDMLESARKHHYTLIIDEVVDVFEDANVKPDDVMTLLRAGYIERTDLGFKVVASEYSDGRLKDLFMMLQHNQLVEVKNGKKLAYYCWMMPKELLEAFDTVIVLTYMFHCQDFCYYMQLTKMDYEYIGVEVTDGIHRLIDTPGYIPPYAAVLKDKIHIVGTRAMNHVGRNKTALSEKWLRRETTGRTELKANLYNYFMNHCRGVSHDRKMWGTYSDMEHKLKGKGYSKNYLVFNKKSSNQYRDKDHLAYCSNVFMNPTKKQWLIEQGADVDEDGWAISIITQWIWRSAIRDGNEIWIYLPSERMRNLLIKWIDDLSTAKRLADEQQTA